MSPTETLIQKAAQLERASPIQWQAFVQALAVYTEVHRDNAILSPIAELPVNQGRAQAMSSLLETLKTAAEKADKINSRKR
jgi:hypothetical protein